MSDGCFLFRFYEILRTKSCGIKRLKPGRYIFRGRFPLFFALVSCTVSPPELVIKGIQADQALSVLEGYSNGKVEGTGFSRYTQNLRDNHTARFHWDQYWSGIKEKQLYKNLKPEDLDRLLSLNQISCKSGHQEAFFDLLLQMAKSDSDTKPLFSRELSRFRETCSLPLPHASFKAIVAFLAEKRTEEESNRAPLPKKTESKAASKKTAIAKSVVPEDSPVSKKSVGEESPAEQAEYIYTRELQKTLVDEWSANPRRAGWGDILEAVDQNFWSAARRANYQSKDREYLQSSLEMERSLHSEAVSGLDRDIFLMFGEKGKMADIMKAAGYGKYLSVPGALDWTALWTEALLKYPEKPENGNADTLLSLYTFSSCLEPELSAYFKLSDGWQMPDYKNRAVMFCRDLRRKAVYDTYDPGEVKKMVQEIYGSAFNAFIEKTERKAALTEYEKLDKALSEASEEGSSATAAPSRAQKSEVRAVREAALLLSAYERERHLHSKQEWRTLLEKHFSENDWLNLMSAFRKRGDRTALGAVLDMHHDLYDGRIPFLAKDLAVILLSGKFSLTELIDPYGYKEAYINKKEVRSRFWEQVSLFTDEEESFDRQGAFQTGADVCGYPYIKDIFLFFSEGGWKDVLIDRFHFDDCADFIKKFRSEEWSRLAELVRRGGESLKEEVRSDFVWRLARVLSLYSGEEDSVLEEAVSQIGVSEYRGIVTELLVSYAEKNPLADMDLFQETLRKIKRVYGKDVDPALCSFFAEEENSSLFIKERGPEPVMDLLKDLSWAETADIRGARGRKETCADIMPEKRRNALLYELAQSLLDKSILENHVFIPPAVSEIWSLTAQIISLSVKMNRLKRSDIWSLSLKALFKRRSEMSDYDFYLRLSELSLSRLLEAAGGDKDVLLHHLKGGSWSVWRKAPPTAYHRAYRDWIENALTYDPHPFQPAGVIYAPLPPFGLNQKENKSKGFKRAEPLFLTGVKKMPAGAAKSPPAGFKKPLAIAEREKFPAVSVSRKESGLLEEVFHRAFRPSPGALFTDPGAFRQGDWKETGAFRKIQSISPAEDAKVDYEQIFLEETADSYDLDYEISVFSGAAVWSNPYISARLVGLEVKKRVRPLVYLGLEYARYKSKISSTISAFENMYGVDVSYPLVKDAVSVKVHYKLFKSHLNLAGVFRIKLDVPLQIGVGAVRTENRDTTRRNRRLSLLWGTGPRIQWSRRWGTRLLLSQSVSAEKLDFLHTWCSLVFVFGF